MYKYSGGDLVKSIKRSYGSLGGGLRESLLGKRPETGFWHSLMNKQFLINFISVTFAWITSVYAYYLISFYVKYIPGDMYTNVIVASLSEVVSCLISGVISSYLGSKRTLGLSFVMGSVFSIGFIIVPSDSTKVIMVLVLLTKFGISSAFNMCYLVTAEFFPI